MRFVNRGLVQKTTGGDTAFTGTHFEHQSGTGIALNEGGWNFDGGSFTVPANTTLNMGLNGGTLTFNNATVNLVGTMRGTGSTRGVFFASGSASGGGTLDFPVDVPLVWSGGSWSNLTNAGAVVTSGGGSVSWSGTLRNTGNFTLNKDMLARAANTQIINTGTFEHQRAGLLHDSYSNVRFVNQGTVKKTTGDGANWIGILFTQTDGALLIEGGTLNANQNLNLQGGRLGGHKATLAADINNTGATIELGTEEQAIGILTLNGNWTQGADATVRIHLAGTNNSDIDFPQYDQLRVVGSNTRRLILNGELQVASSNSYTPNVGDTYDIIVRTSGSWTLTGAFSTVRGIGVLRCYTFAVEYLSDRVRLSVTGTTGGSGDVNGDGCVDDADLLQVLFAFGQEGSELEEDLNCDGVVDDADLLVVLFNFGSGC